MRILHPFACFLPQYAEANSDPVRCRPDRCLREYTVSVIMPQQLIRDSALSETPTVKQPLTVATHSIGC